MTEQLTVDELLVGDCYELLPNIPDESIDLILTSPPYASARSKAYESVVDINVLGTHFERILKPGGVLCWNIGDPVEGGNKTTISYQCVVRWTEDIPNPLCLHDHYALLKDPMPGNSSQRSRPGWEHMYVYKKKGTDKIVFNNDHTRVRYTNSVKKAVTSRIRQQDGSLVEFTRDQSSDPRGKDPGNYLYYPLGSGHTTQDDYAYDHPALMAEAIAEDFILSYTNPGMVVLDPFNGAGTTTKMAYKHERHYIGIELERRFKNIAQKRIDDTTPLLFEPQPLYTEEEMSDGSDEYNEISFPKS